MNRNVSRHVRGGLAALALVLAPAAEPALGFNCHVDQKVEQEYYWQMTPAAIEAMGEFDFDAAMAGEKANRAANGQTEHSGVVFLRRGEANNGIVDVSATPVFLGRAGGNSAENYLRSTCGYTVHPYADSLEISGFQRGMTAIDFGSWVGKQPAYQDWLAGLEAAPESWPDRNRAELRIDAPELAFSLGGHSYTYLIDEADTGIVFDETSSGGPGATNRLVAAAMAKFAASGENPVRLQARRVLGRLFTDALPPEDSETYPAEFDDLAAAKPGTLRSLEAGFRPQPVNVGQTPYYYGSIRIQAGRKDAIHNHNGLGFFIDGKWMLHAISVDGAETEIDLRPWISRQSGKAYYMSFEISDPVIDVDMGASHLRLVAFDVTLMLDKKGGNSLFSITADLFSDDPEPPMPAARI